MKAVSKSRRKLKKKAVEYKGGKCVICGYNRCIGALEFHHFDGDDKEFNISHSSFGWEKVKKELDKCILICANCHRELKEGIVEIPSEATPEIYKN